MELLNSPDGANLRESCLFGDDYLFCVFRHLDAAYQTDFSVTNRLLSPYNNGSGLPHHQPSVTISYRNDGSCGQQPSCSQMPGWQSMLPNDQGGVSAKHYSSWRSSAVVPNTNLPQGPACYPAVGYGGAGPSSYHPTHSPDSSTGLTGKENTAIGTPLSDGDKLGKKGSGLEVHALLYQFGMFGYINQGSLVIQSNSIR